MIFHRGLVGVGIGIGIESIIFRSFDELVLLMDYNALLIFRFQSTPIPIPTPTLKKPHATPLAESPKIVDN